MLLPFRSSGQRQRLIIVLINSVALMGCSGSTAPSTSIRHYEQTQNDTSLNNVPYRPLNQLTPAASQWSAPADPELTPLTPAPPAQSKTPDPEPQHRWGCIVHQTQPGDTLYSIAQDYYGNGKYWRFIGRNNLDALSNQGQLLADAMIYLSTDPLKTSADTLRSPGQIPVAYITAPADTIEHISSWLSVDPQTLKSLNHLPTSTDQLLPPGSKLKCR